MERGQVNPRLGWKGQPPLVYVTSSTTYVDRRGKSFPIGDCGSWEYRGTVQESDLRKIEAKAKK